MTLRVTLNDTGFALFIETTEGLFAGAGVCFVDQRFELPVTGDTATGHFRTTAPSGDVYECDVELEAAPPGS